MQSPMITAQTFAGGDDQGENEKAGKSLKRHKILLKDLTTD